jgi:hypothetical protein
MGNPFMMKETSSHNPYPPTPSSEKVVEDQEKYYYPDTTLDKAFIIANIRKLLDDNHQANGSTNGSTESADQEAQGLVAQGSSNTNEGVDHDDKEIQQDGGSVEDSLEAAEKEKIEACCFLWDISSNADHTRFLYENHIVPVLQKVITTPHSSRLVEVAVGVLANMVTAAAEIAEDISRQEISTIVAQLLFEADDPAVLNEVTRMITACICTPGCRAKWMEMMKENEHALLRQTLAILQNTLNMELMERVLTLVAFLIYGELQKELIDFGIADIVSDLLISLYKNENEEGVTAPSESILDMALRIIEALCVLPGSGLTDENEDLVECLGKITKVSESDEFVMSTLLILSNILSESGESVKDLARDKEFCRALLDHLSADNTAAWDVLNLIVPHALGVIVDCVDTILSAADDEQPFITSSLSNILKRIEERITARPSLTANERKAYEVAKQKLNEWRSHKQEKGSVQTEQ